MEIKKLTIDDNLYPDFLRQIDDAPKLLYYIGDIGLMQKPGLAVVGTRRASPYGRWVSYELGKIIGRSGRVLVSGMAEGIDARAHLGCLASGGKTIAVLGSAIDNCYPKSNLNLYKEIAVKGLILSEYQPGSVTKNWAFPRRNRIISGLSDSVTVVEGGIKSGSMITAGWALSQGRDVFAVPGNISQPDSLGVNSLIRDGAMPILSLDDAAETLGIKKQSAMQMRAELGIEEKNVLSAVSEFPGITFDELSYKLEMDISTLGYILTSLELKAYIRKTGNLIYPLYN